MEKYLSLIIGMFVNILLLPFIRIHSWQTIVALLLGIFGLILAISKLKKAQQTWQKACLILSGVLNIIPFFYFIVLIFYIV